ncbi:extracellular solute-binding protein [Psychrobacter sp. FDAARGOS_221]|uniref:extracellular solute-binding protein n=1 Tax=Psychrobacter sp. FDAARGOS_221 TaxID=1975705 RepID=UPI000BB59895|nr:extracellular solute-binding protein [Psychrobacter sp. FDAARGOS_221]PNK59731.1 ABC transporter substrate-binding protein [Psychrobacter sp. FDAARGOS_221]
MKRRNPKGTAVIGFKAIAALLITTAASVIPTAMADPVTVSALGHNTKAAYTSAPYMPYANPNAPKGGVLSQSAIGTFNSANMWMTTGIAMRGTEYLYDTLMTGSLDESFVMYPQLAEKVTYDPEDTSWIIYHINPKAKFWDGSAVTAEDVEATYDAYLNKGLMQVRSYLSAIESIEVIDTHRVKFHFASADNKEILLTVAQFPIFKKASVEKEFETLSLKPMMGSGPYQLDHVEQGRSVTYRRDPNYWGQQVMANKGRFNFDYIKYVYYGSDEVALEGFKVGQYHFRQESSARKWATAYNFPAVKAGLIKKESISSHNPVMMQALVMNLRKPLFADIRVRQALTDAFDFELMNKTLFYDQYERLESYFHGSELAATGEPSEREKQMMAPLLDQLDPVQKKYALSEWQLPKSDGKGYPREALLQAREKLLEAGFYYQNMKLYQPNGKPAKLEILIADDKITRVLLPYVRNLKKLGFDASIRQVDSPQYLERLRRFDYDMIIGGFPQGLSPGAEQSYMWGSQAADEVGNQNYSGIKNEAIDEVINKLILAEDREQIVLYSKVLDRLLRAGFYMVPMYGTSNTRVVYWDKYRHVDKLPDNGVGLDYWWVDGEAESKVNRYLKH